MSVHGTMLVGDPDLIPVSIVDPVFGRHPQPQPQPEETGFVEAFLRVMAPMIAMLEGKEVG